jgi:hypothetical protein
MRNLVLTMVAAVVVALTGSSRAGAAPVNGAAINDALRSLTLNENVHCRAYYHCHGYGCHVCGGGGYYRGYRGYYRGRGYRYGRGYRGRGYRGGRGFRGGGRGRGGGRRR